MPVRTLEQLLDQCVADIRAGRATLEQCLAAHPAERADLEPLLRIALHVAPPDIQIDPARRARARVQFVEALHAEKERASRRWWGLLPLPAALAGRRLSAPVALSVAAVAAAATGGGAAYASQDALPGSPLYGVKTAIEQAQVALAPTDEARTQVQLVIASRRLAEVEQAVALHNDDAARRAAESYAATVVTVSEQIVALEEQGKDAGVLAEQLASNLEQQQATLQLAAQRAPEPAAAALDRARKRAAHGLQRVKGKSSRGDQPAAAGKPEPFATAAPAVSAAASGASDPSPTATAASMASATDSPPPAPEQAGRAGKADEPAVAAVDTGDTFAGLKAKLDAAAAALERGQEDTARNQLNALQNQLDALARSERLSGAELGILKEAYGWLERKLKDRNSDEESRNRDDQGRRGDDAGGEGAGPPPAADTPADGSGRHDNRDDGQPQNGRDDRGEQRSRGQSRDQGSDTADNGKGSNDEQGNGNGSDNRNDDRGDRSGDDRGRGNNRN